MKSLITALSFIFIVFLSSFVYASPGVTKCEGPAELCAQIQDLQVKLNAQKAADVAEVDAVKTAQEKKSEERTVKLITAAGMIAALLKALLSALSSWKEYFTTVKGQAWMRAITLATGLLAFFLTNVGFGIPWWQALIIAGGGPGAIVVHELMKLIPAIRGKGALPPESDKPKALGLFVVV